MLQRRGDDSASGCLTKAGYSDISAGSQVTVADGSGETVGVATLGSADVSENAAGSARVCQFSFTVSGIPAGSRFYSVHIGNANRGDQSYTQEELEDGIALSIG